MPRKTTKANLWTFTAEDRAAARELAARLPDRLFDAHAHLYEQAHVAPTSPLIRTGPATAGVAVWRRCLGKQVGAARLAHALCVPLPSKHGGIGVAREPQGPVILWE